MGFVFGGLEMERVEERLAKEASKHREKEEDKPSGDRSIN